MVIDGAVLEAMVKEADLDGSGEIDFTEFLQIITRAQAAGGASKGGFAALISRKQNSGPPMKWRGDKFGKGVSVDGPVAKRNSSSGWAGQLLDQWLSSAGYDAASVLLEFLNVAGGDGCYVGVVRRAAQSPPPPHPRRHPRPPKTSAACFQTSRPALTFAPRPAGGLQLQPDRLVGRLPDQHALHRCAQYGRDDVLQGPARSDGAPRHNSPSARNGARPPRGPVARA